VVILLTRLLVIGLDLGELDLHVVIAAGQPVPTDMLGKAYSGRGNWKRYLLRRGLFGTAGLLGFGRACIVRMCAKDLVVNELADLEREEEVGMIKYIKSSFSPLVIETNSSPVMAGSGHLRHKDKTYSSWL